MFKKQLTPEGLLLEDLRSHFAPRPCMLCAHCIMRSALTVIMPSCPPVIAHCGNLHSRLSLISASPVLLDSHDSFTAS